MKSDTCGKLTMAIEIVASCKMVRISDAWQNHSLTGPLLQ